jgi:hypothetical protein
MPYTPSPTPKPVIKSKYSPKATGTGARIREPALQPQTNQTPSPRTTTRAIKVPNPRSTVTALGQTVGGSDRTNIVRDVRLGRAAKNAQRAGAGVVAKKIQSAYDTAQGGVLRPKGSGSMLNKATRPISAAGARNSLRQISKGYGSMASAVKGDPLSTLAKTATRKLTRS